MSLQRELRRELARVLADAAARFDPALHWDEPCEWPRRYIVLVHDMLRRAGFWVTPSSPYIPTNPWGLARAQDFNRPNEVDYVHNVIHNGRAKQLLPSDQWARERRAIHTLVLSYHPVPRTDRTPSPLRAGPHDLL